MAPGSSAISARSAQASRGLVNMKERRTGEPESASRVPAYSPGAMPAEPVARAVDTGVAERSEPDAVRPRKKAADYETVGGTAERRRHSILP